MSTNEERGIISLIESATLLGAWLRPVEDAPLTERGMDRLMRDLEEEPERWDGQS